MLRSVMTAALAVMATPAVAQDWAPMAPSNQTTAVGVRWDNGTGAVARCREGRFQILFTLPAPIAGETIEVRASDTAEGESHPNLWRMTPQGNATLARLPVRTAERWLRGRTMYVTFPGHEQQALPPPGSEEALLGVLADCGHRIDLDRPETPAEVTVPSWLSRPDGWVMRRYYPAAAAQQSVPGEVQLNCVVTADGRLDDCITVSESPRNGGFGAASIALSTEFRLNPRLEDGVAVGEHPIVFTIHWAMDPRFERD